MPRIMMACCLFLDYLGRKKGIKIHTHGVFGELHNFNYHGLILMIQNSLGTEQEPAETGSLLKAEILQIF